MSNEEARRLTGEELGWSCPEDCLEFETTAEIKPLEGTIGQDRALEALKLGLSLYAPGYNMFVCGLSGTRKTETVQEILEELEPQCALPPDRAYVHNFELPDEPNLLTLPRGRAHAFARQMDQLVEDLRVGLSRLQREESLARRRQEVIHSYEAKGRELFQPFEEKAEEAGFVLVQRSDAEGTRPDLMPAWEGSPVSWADLEEKVREEKLEAGRLEELRERHRELLVEMQQLVTRSMNLGRDLRRELRELTRTMAGEIVGELVGEVREAWSNEEITAYLGRVETAVLEDLELFMEEPGEGELGGEAGHLHRSDEDDFVEYRVKVVLDAGGKKECPIIVEQSPSHQNIFGTVEYSAAEGSPRTDHTRIKAGDILEADGGYLVLDAYDALSEPGVWRDLKRTLLHQKLQLQPTIQAGLPLVALRLKPDPIEISTKVVMVGDRYLYRVLQETDEDFLRVFKVLADFDEVVERTEDNVVKVARFIARLVTEEGLAHFTREAVAVVVSRAVRDADDREKLTARLNLLADLMREADHVRRTSGEELVSGEHVREALRGIRHRNSLLEEKIQESIRRDIQLVATAGSRIGMVNGLSVWDLGTYRFGKPTRITAAVGIGRGGILNIERESDLSGSTHDKGVLILGGFLRDRFAQERPLSLDASLAFEQSYSEIDGDSASSAECYALLSALSGLALRQDVAVTGSINQKGDLQAIGGVNEKIEGFYDVCKERGLSGSQGVLIPESNVQHLALREEVIEAVEAGRFHVWAAGHVDQGLALLTGEPAGERDRAGRWSEGSVNARVESRLATMAEEIRDHFPVLPSGDGGA